MLDPQSHLFVDTTVDLGLLRLACYRAIPKPG